MSDVLDIAVERLRRDRMLAAADRAYARAKGAARREAAAWDSTLLDGLTDEED